MTITTRVETQQKSGVEKNIKRPLKNSLMASTEHPAHQTELLEVKHVNRGQSRTDRLMGCGSPGWTDMKVKDSLEEDDECRTHRRKRVSESQSE